MSGLRHWRRHRHDDAVQVLDQPTPAGFVHGRLADAGDHVELDLYLVRGWQRLARVTFPNERRAKTFAAEEISRLCSTSTTPSSTPTRS